MRKVSRDLANGGKYAESFGLSTLTGAICGNFLSNKIVGLLLVICKTVLKAFLLSTKSDRTNPVTALNILTM